MNVVANVVVLALGVFIFMMGLRYDIDLATGIGLFAMIIPLVIGND